MAPVAISRAALIERIMKETPLLDDGASERVPVQEERLSPRRRTWSSVGAFVHDNLAEIEHKLAHIEPQIWGKLIVMERNFRTAKAYLRNPTIAVDGTQREFDGITIGLAQFENDYRDARTEAALRALTTGGLRLHVDDHGNLWMRRTATRLRASAKTRQRKEPVALTDEYRKVFDLRVFKETVVATLASGVSDAGRLRESALVFVRLTECGGEEGDVLRHPLWLCVAHLIALDMVDTIASEFGLASGSSGAGTDCPSSEDSCASSSSYLPSGSSAARANKSGVARRIFQQKRPTTTAATPSTASHYSAPFPPEAVRHSTKRTRSHSQTRSAPALASRPLETSVHGWSLLNLADIDKLRTPAYFASSEEAGSRRARGEPGRRRRSRTARRETTTDDADLGAPAGLTKYKWLSETCLRSPD